MPEGLGCAHNAPNLAGYTSGWPDLSLTVVLLYSHGPTLQLIYPAACASPAERISHAKSSTDTKKWPLHHSTTCSACLLPQRASLQSYSWHLGSSGKPQRLQYLEVSPSVLNWWILSACAPAAANKDSTTVSSCAWLSGWPSTC